MARSSEPIQGIGTAVQRRLAPAGAPSHCLYCDRRLGGPADAARRPDGATLAFDPARERVWTVCERCRGWNLWWGDARRPALERLERSACDRGRVLYETSHIALLDIDGRRLVRVGRAPRREEAWWRYGRRLRRRHDWLHSPVTAVSAATYAAVSSLGRAVGLERLTGDFRGTEAPRLEIARWRRFGATAWQGRAPCPRCSSVLIRLFFFKSPDLILLPDRDGEVAVGLPCMRCDPWTVEKTYRFDPAAARTVLRRALAWHNLGGASRREVGRAVRLVTDAGGADGFTDRLAERRISLQSLGRAERLALEMAVNERAERRRLAGEAAALEAAWRHAEELASIVDEL